MAEIGDFYYSVLLINDSGYNMVACLWHFTYFQHFEVIFEFDKN